MHTYSFYHIIEKHPIDTKVCLIFYSVFSVDGLKTAAERSENSLLFPVHSTPIQQQKMLKRPVSLYFWAYPLLKDTHAAAGSLNT